MKTYNLSSFILLLGIAFPCSSQSEGTKGKDSLIYQYWTWEKAEKLASDFNSPEKWDYETLEMEVRSLEKYPPSDFPLYDSPFPTPKYSSPGNGNSPLTIEIGGKKLIGHNVIIGKGEHSEHLFENADDQYISYFTVLTITDGKVTDNLVSATSRNHPHYLSQGSLNTSTKSRVDWIAMQLADRNAYAVINSRLFDLRFGRLILAAPQTDGSIRFYQTDAHPMNSDELQSFLEDLKNDQKVIKFLKNRGNI